MNAKCISNLSRSLPKELIRPDLGLSADKEFHLVAGKDYVVYAMTWFLGHVWFYVCDESYSHYPVWNPSPLFTLTNNRLSSFWHLGFHRGGNLRDIISIVAFKEWVDDPLFYDRLTDGQKSAVETFARYKKLMDAEYN